MRIRPPALYAMLGFRPTGDLGDFTLYTNRRNKTVIFLKAPPRKPPSETQLQQRARWSVIAAGWQSLPDARRHAWLRAARAAGLSIGGYNLFVWYACNPDPAVLATICRRAGITPEDLL